MALPHSLSPDFKIEKPLQGWRLRWYTVIFEADTQAGRLFDKALIGIILLSIGIVMADSVEALHLVYGRGFLLMEWVFTVLFTLEYIARLVCTRRPLRYALSFYGLIDLVALLPTYLALFMPELHALIDVRVLRLLRVFRVFKLTAYVEEYQSLGRALAASRRKILVFLTAVLMVVLIMGTVMYVVEGRENNYTSIPTSVYWAITTMTTVGFGDIVPHTTDARMFTLTVIILGITIFAISVASIAGPLISNNIQRIVKGRITHMARKNHYILVGVGSLAQNVYKGLTDRGEHVTVVCATGSQHDLPEKADIIEGDPSSVATLKLAGAADAKYIVTLCDNDAENVFTILAAKEIAGDDTQIIALVNETRNMPKVKRVNPTMVLSLPLLGSELLVRTLEGDEINNSLITEMFFGKRTSLA